MKKRTFFLLASAAALTIGYASLISANVIGVLPTFGEHTTHDGNHYTGKAATVTESGYQEFWVCCECHESFLVKPEGNFVDADPTTMVGGVSIGHVAYLPSEMETVADEAIVKGYTPHSYFEESGTYEFNIFEGTKDLRLINEIVAQAAATMFETVRANANNSAQVQGAYAIYRATLTEEYAKDMVAQTTHVLRTLFGTVNQGLLAAGSNPSNTGTHIEVGEAGGWGTWVAIDPLNTAWGSADNRYWIPEAYKASAIIAWAETLATTLTTVDEIETALRGLMTDSARCVGQFIIEAEVFYALKTTGVLTLGGNSAVSVWWYMWTYYGESGLINASTNTSYDPSTCTAYRLCGAIYQPGRADYAETLEQVISTANWVIANQVDDMF